jgi:hypothetical protein
MNGDPFRKSLVLTPPQTFLARAFEFPDLALRDTLRFLGFRDTAAVHVLALRRELG